MAQNARDELFWNVMGRFERQALAQYRERVTGLTLSAKAACLREIEALVPEAHALPEGALRDSMAALFESTQALEERMAIVVAQGLVLEQVRRSVYAAVAKSPTAVLGTRALAHAARAASAEVSSECVMLFSREIERDKRFACFAAASDELLQRLDGLGEHIDATFGDGYEVRFSHVVGDFVAELVPLCTSLGMDRRRVLGHLSSALMGF